MNSSWSVSFGVRRCHRRRIHLAPHSTLFSHTFVQAFEFLDTNKKGYITAQDLREKLGIFYKNLSSRDYKLLMQGKVRCSLPCAAPTLSSASHVSLISPTLGLHRLFLF
jgi:hypothetical protein